MKETVDASDPHRQSAAELLLELLASQHELGGPAEELAALAAAEIGRDSPVSCGITLIRNRRATIVGVSNEAAKRFDEILTDVDSGPRAEAQKTRSLIRIDDAEDEKCWRSYVEIAVLHGLRSMVVVPLDIDDTADAIMSFYSRQPYRFGEQTLSAVHRLGKLVERSLRVAVRSARFAEAAEHRQRAMESRTVIDIAVGITMAQAACSQGEAVAILKEASSHRNIKLRTLAGDIVASLNQPEPTTPFTD
ncbi:GAF and ANTAR domain-containing protein [Brevibacterium atlanticum]|uniref:GAF and ANTAR domain-containing protein n=1 Tax=Brevibacterium atlanticum TaxID=2697563 RepID=UPI00141F7762|nr:GAF and ANTAR domain-containing protein [Brevibacterium atlanticum]